MGGLGQDVAGNSLSARNAGKSMGGEVQSARERERECGGTSWQLHALVHNQRVRK